MSLRANPNVRIVSTFVVGLLFVFALASLSMCAKAKASLLSTQVWQWDELPNATRYRLYWSPDGQTWCTQKSVQFGASMVCAGGTCQGDVPFESGTLYLAVSATNAEGREGPLGHGVIGSCP